MIFNELPKLEIKGRFKFYPFLVCGVDKKIYQLTHFKRRRTCYFKEIVLDQKRNGYRINSDWVPRNRLLKFIIEKNETLTI